MMRNLEKIGEFLYGPESIPFTQADRRYFEEHPGEEFYIRPRQLGEVAIELQVADPAEIADGDRVIVVQIRPGVRLRTVAKARLSPREIAAFVRSAKESFGGLHP
jgi:hypothetical protein